MIKKTSFPKFLWLLILACCQLTLSAQDSPNWKWWNPANANSSVLEGQAWADETASFYVRLPQRAEKQVRAAVWHLSQQNAGEYINFKTSATSIVVKYTVDERLAMSHMPATGVSGVDLYARDINGQWKWARGRFSFGDTIVYRFNNLALSANEEEFRLYLPLYNKVNWMSIGVPESASFTPYAVSKELPIVAYGTSIMQGACASRPGLAWTNILGRKLDREIINLGFSGNGELEPEVLSLINEIEAKLYILDCMPNLHNKSDFSPQEVKKRIVNSVKKLQSKHPHTPILLVEHCCGLPNSNMDTSLANKYRDVSLVAANTFTEMKKSGIENIFLLTAEQIGFDHESTVDGTHPNDLGMMKYANAYEKIIRKILHEEQGEISTTRPVRQRRDHATYDFMDRHNAVLKTVKEKQAEVVFIGNSITHFWGGLPDAGINRGADSWNTYFEPLNAVNLGFGWDKIENVLWRVHHGELDGYTAEKIVLNIGTNNLSVTNNDDEIINGLTFLIKAIQQRQPKASLFVSGIYPRRNMEKRIAGLNKRLKAMTGSQGCTFINPGQKLLGENGKIDEKLFSDGLHPNAKGYNKLGLALHITLTKNL